MATIRCKDKTFSNVTGILFDKDGTLADSRDFLRTLGYKRARLVDAKIPGVGESLLMACGLEAEVLNPAGLLAAGSRRENEIATAAYIAETGRDWLEARKLASEAFEEAERLLDDTTPSPLFMGCLEAIESLAKAGLKIGILSADSTENVRRFVAESGLRDYVRLEMGVDTNIKAGASKPEPELFWNACNALGTQPEQTLMVGDSPQDIEMAKLAKAAGSIGICWRDPETARLEGADVAIADLDEIEIVED